MPLFHVGGIARNVLSPIISGGAVVAMPCAAALPALDFARDRNSVAASRGRYFEPSLFWSVCAQKQATWYCANTRGSNTRRPRGSLPPRALSAPRPVRRRRGADDAHAHPGRVRCTSEPPSRAVSHRCIMLGVPSQIQGARRQGLARADLAALHRQRRGAAAAVGGAGHARHAPSEKLPNPSTLPRSLPCCCWWWCCCSLGATTFSIRQVLGGGGRLLLDHALVRHDRVHAHLVAARRIQPRPPRLETGTLPLLRASPADQEIATLAPRCRHLGPDRRPSVPDPGRRRQAAALRRGARGAHHGQGCLPARPKLPPAPAPLAAGCPRAAQGIHSPGDSQPRGWGFTARACGQAIR